MTESTTDQQWPQAGNVAIRQIDSYLAQARAELLQDEALYLFETALAHIRATVVRQAEQVERLRKALQEELARHTRHEYAFSDGYWCGGCARQPAWPCSAQKNLSAALEAG